jgi:hypothetical protein
MTLPDRIVWPAAQYDAFKAKAEELGGVGKVDAYHRIDWAAGELSGTPCCAYGIAHSLGLIQGKDTEDLLTNEDNIALLGFPCYWNDNVVRSIVGCGTRAPFDQWASKMGIVRGAA